MVLAIPQEKVYMWRSPKPVSIPNLLYALTRYGSFMYQAIGFLLNFLPPSKIVCNGLVYYIQGAIAISGYVGTQGLLIARGYSLCGGNKIVTRVLALLFLGGLALSICSQIKAVGCYSQISIEVPLLNLAENICVISTDLIVFGICLWKVWDTWKLKREIGIRKDNDLVTVLLNQTVSRFCFVIIFTATFLILVFIDQFRSQGVINITDGIQHSLSAVLLADFTLDLRQQNSAAIQAANLTLPTIRLDSVASYIHQSILVEMGDHGIPIYGTAEDDNSLSAESPDAEMRHEVSA